MDGGAQDSLLTRWTKIDQLKGRDADSAWQWFLDRYRPYVVAVLTSLTRNRQKGEQAAEDFWAYFFQHRIHEKADRGRRFRTYLSGVLRRFGKDWSRKAWVAQDPDPNAVPPDPAVVDPVAENEETRLFARALIHNALGRLASGEDLEGKRVERLAKPEAARMLRLFYGIPEQPEDRAPEPMKASQVAATLGVTLDANAMHKRLHDTRARFRELVVEEVSQTVPSRADLDDELHLIFAAIQDIARGLVA